VFGLVQGTANKIEPGKRMLSSMSPTIALDDKNAVFMLAGAGGGPRIITAVWQTLSNVIDFRMDIGEAVASPRLHHQHLPDVVHVEGESIDRATDEALEKMGYKLDWDEYFGSITAIERGAPGWHGSADARNGGKAMGD
jgi:gamma-glutamyltranspeptidase/glutathione hydrolase